MESYCSLCTFKVPQGANNLILCTLDTIHRLCFVTRLIINQINKVQWVDFKLENVPVSLHSLKTMGLGSINFKEWRVTWTFSYQEIHLKIALCKIHSYVLWVMTSTCNDRCNTKRHIKVTGNIYKEHIRVTVIILYSVSYG